LWEEQVEEKVFPPEDPEECYCWMFLSVSGLRRNEKRVASCMHAEIRT